MKRISIAVLVTIVALALGSTASLAQQKLAQTGFQFLSVGTDARATAMGDAFTSVDAGAASLFYNPATLALTERTLNFSVNQMTWIADINYLSGAVCYNPARGRYGTFGLSFVTVDYGDFYGTVVSTSEKGYEDTGMFSVSAMALGLSYAHQLSDRFSVGGQVKYTYQDLGAHTTVANTRILRDEITPDDLIQEDYNRATAAFDFGTFYRTGFKSLAFGMSVRNFSQDIRYEKETFQLPLTFKIGFSMDVLDFLPQMPENHEFLLSVDAAHPRSFPEYISVGGEYKLMQILSLRAGYVGSQSDYGFVAGFGVSKFGVSIDYSYAPFTIFEDVNRISVRFAY
jgi:hypothetical protein